MGKRLFEIFIVLFILFHILYMIFYTYSFEDFCNKFSSSGKTEVTDSIGIIAQCKDSIICETNNIERTNSNKVLQWECNKIERDTFFPVYYYNIFKESILR